MIHDPPDSLDSLPYSLPTIDTVLSWVTIWAGVQNEITPTMPVDHRRVRAAEPVVGYYAVRAHGVRS